MGGIRLSMWQAAKAFIGLSEVIEEDDFNQGLQQSSPKVPVERTEKKNKVTFELLNNNPQPHGFRKKQLNQPHNMAIKIANSFEDAQQIADYIKNNCPLIVNLKNLDGESTRKLTAFLSGTAYALDATVNKLHGQMILVAPAGMAIACDNNEQNIFASYQAPVQSNENIDRIDFQQYAEQEPESPGHQPYDNRHFSFS